MKFSHSPILHLLLQLPSRHRHFFTNNSTGPSLWFPFPLSPLSLSTHTFTIFSHYHLLLLSLREMFEFSNLSDVDDSAAIDDIISQAQDPCVLEQVSAIKCSGFTDSALPTDLESRFRKRRWRRRRNLNKIQIHRHHHRCLLLER